MRVVVQRVLEASVTIDGNKLVCIPGGPQATVVALDKKSGRPIWACPVPNDPGAGHASIVIAKVGGRPVYVTTTAGGAVGCRRFQRSTSRASRRSC